MENNEVKATEVVEEATVNEETVTTKRKPWKKWLIIVAVFLLLAVIIDSCSKSENKTLGVENMVWSNINESLPMGTLVSTGNFCDPKWDGNKEDRVWVEFRDKNDGSKYKIFFDVFNNKTQATITSVTKDYEYLSELELMEFYKYLGQKVSYQDWKDYLLGLDILNALF